LRMRYVVVRRRVDRSATLLSATATDRSVDFLSSDCTTTSESSALVIQKAEAAWAQDPFLEIRKPQATRPEAPAAKCAVRLPGNLVYSGFIEIGAKRMAIISGMEYEAGDLVNPGGFTLKSILPTKVLMVATQRDGTQIELPLQEIE